MALLPFLLDDPFDFDRPSRILDQHFGIGLDPDDFLAPLTIPRRFRPVLNHAGYVRPWRTHASQQDVGSTVKADRDRFQANLDVQQFAPEEISVKVIGDNQITVEGNHEEKKDEHGYISRKFVRKYVLPKNYDINKIESKLSSDGVLTITAPSIDQEKIEYRQIPITATGKPSKEGESESKKGSGDKK